MKNNLIIVAIFVLAGCASAPRIQKGDTLRIETRSVPSGFVTTCVVDEAGMITLEEVGQFEASGKTCSQLGSQIQAIRTKAGFAWPVTVTRNQDTEERSHNH